MIGCICFFSMIFWNAFYDRRLLELTTTDINNVKNVSHYQLIVKYLSENINPHNHTPNVYVEGMF